MWKPNSKYCCSSLKQVLNMFRFQRHAFGSSSSVMWTNFMISPLHYLFDKMLPVASTIPIKLGSVKFQLQIINGRCTSITNVEVTFIAAGFFTINIAKFKVLFWPNQTSTKHKL